MTYDDFCNMRKVVKYAESMQRKKSKFGNKRESLRTQQSWLHSANFAASSKFCGTRQG